MISVIMTAHQMTHTILHAVGSSSSCVEVCRGQIKLCSEW